MSDEEGLVEPKEEEESEAEEEALGSPPGSPPSKLRVPRAAMSQTRAGTSGSTDTPPRIPAPFPSANFPVCLLNDTNYVAWAQKMELILARERLWRWTRMTPTAGDATAEDEDQRAKAYIGLSISEELMVHVRGLEHAKDYWDVLRQLYARDSVTSRICLTRKLWRSRLEPCGDLRAHLRSMTQTFQDLEAINEIIPERQKCYTILNSLDESWDTFVLTLEAVPQDQLTVAYVSSRLLEEAQRRCDNQLERDNRKAKPSNTAKKPQVKKEDGGQAQIFAVKKCWHCGSPKHLARDCKKKKQAQQPQQGQKQQPAAPQQKANIANVFSVTGVQTRTSWLLDSGASHHIVVNPNVLTNKSDADCETVALANGMTAPVTCSGDLFLPQLQTTLRNVLCVPTMTRNLLSLGCLIEDGFVVTFRDNVCIVEKDTIRLEVPKVYKMYVLGARTPKETLAAPCFNQAPHSNCQHLWHLRLAHLSPPYLQKTAERVRGMNLSDCGAFVDCETCKLAKSHRAPIPKFSTRQSQRPFELVHMDLIGPLKQTLGGMRYVFLIVDDHTRYCFAFLLRQKSEVFKKFHAWVGGIERRFGHKLVAIQSDRGGEFLGREMTDWLEQQGIEHRLSAPRTPQHNGIAERRGGVIQTMTAALLHQAKLPHGFWGEALKTAIFLSNRVYHRSIDGIPYEKLFNRAPDLSFLKVFGSYAWVNVDRSIRKKHEPKARKLQCLGYDLNSKALRFLNPDRKTVTVSNSYTFCEQGMLPEKQDGIVEIPAFPRLEEGGGDAEESASRQADTTPQRQGAIPQTPHRGGDESPAGGDSPGLDVSTSTDMSESSPETAVPQRRILPPRALRGVPPERLTFQVSGTATVPQSYQEVQGLPKEEREKWEAAMGVELKAMHDLNVFEPATLPKGRKAIDCRWVFVKKNPEGAAPVFRARLVARGCKQTPGVDFEEIFSPTLAASTLRAALAVAASKNLEVHHFDVATAYLHSQLQEEIYILPPPGMKCDSSHLRLRRALYGLRQSGRSWFLCLKDELQKLGFSASEADPCLFTRGEGESWCACLC